MRGSALGAIGVLLFVACVSVRVVAVVFVVLIQIGSCVSAGSLLMRSLCMSTVGCCLSALL